MAMGRSERFRNRDHVAINALWVGVHFQDAALLSIIVPAILLQLTPSNHTYALALLSTVVAIATSIIPPIVGALSDRRRRQGNDRGMDDRRVQTAIVLAIDAIALVAMAYASTVYQFGTATIVATVALMSGSVIYQVLVPEIVPRNFWGAAAGYRGAMTLVGTIIGLALAALLPARTALLTAAAGVVVSALTLVFVPPAQPFVATPRREGPHIRDRHDLIVTLVARAWVVMGMTLLNTYVLYFFHDVLGIRNASLNTGLVAAAAMVGAVVSSITAGIVSDKVDRRFVVCLSGLPMTLAALGFALYPDLRVIFVYALLFGLGYGGVFAVGWALALDSVPELGDVARDLGIWGTLSNLPMIIAPAIGAAIITGSPTLADGYRWLFACAGACFLLGSLSVLAAHKPSAVTE